MSAIGHNLLWKVRNDCVIPVLHIGQFAGSRAAHCTHHTLCEQGRKTQLGGSAAQRRQRIGGAPCPFAASFGTPCVPAVGGTATLSTSADGSSSPAAALASPCGLGASGVGEERDPGDIGGSVGSMSEADDARSRARQSAVTWAISSSVATRTFIVASTGIRQTGHSRRREAQRAHATSCAHGISTQLIEASIHTMHEIVESIDVRPRPTPDMPPGSATEPKRDSVAVVLVELERPPHRREWHSVSESSRSSKHRTTAPMATRVSAGTCGQPQCPGGTSKHGRGVQRFTASSQ